MSTQIVNPYEVISDDMRDRVEKKALDNFIAARIQLNLRYPAMMPLVLPLVPVIDWSSETGWTDQIRIGFNPQWFMSMNREQQITFLLHETKHCVFGHPVRAKKQKLDHKRANIAGDFAINWLIAEMGFELPPDALHDYEYSNMSLEQIYNKLPALPKPDEQPQNQSEDNSPDGGGDPSGDKSTDNQQDLNNRDTGNKNGDGQNEQQQQGNEFQSSLGEFRTPETNQQGEDITDGDLNEIQVNWRERVKEAARIAKARGDGSAGWDRMIEEIVNPVIPWQEQLMEYVEENANNDYSYIYPDRIYLDRDIFMPSINEPELQNMVVIIDMSGSVSEEDARFMISEVASIGANFDTTINILYHDTKVTGKDILLPGGDPRELKPKGGGGTDTRPAYRELNRMIRDGEIPRPECVIHFTDGYFSKVEMPESRDIEYPVLWVLTEKPYGYYEFNPHFGQTIFIVDQP